MLSEVLVVVQLMLLSAALPLAVIAANGYRDAPFGSVLRMLPIIAGAFAVEAVATLLPLSTSTRSAVSLGASTVGVLAIAWAAIQLVHLLTGRRRI